MSSPIPAQECSYRHWTDGVGVGKKPVSALTRLVRVVQWWCRRSVAGSYTDLTLRNARVFYI